MRALVLHGWQNHRPAGHWQAHLARRLADAGHDVAYPQLPRADTPDVDRWLEVLERHLVEGTVDLVVCHSLACLLWVRAVETGLVGGATVVGRLVLVAPVATAVVLGHPEIAAFAPSGPWPDLAPGSRHRPCLVRSDDDPYSPHGLAAELAQQSTVDEVVLPGQAHLDLTAGYGAWPSLERWCLTGSGAISPR
ncbi:RBBP9/YdeN family alpha/beta hydrolase [Aquipuribacter nitratireducens]|uniref:RBBP9/YdeN family alpha/beta hydrolase n=1 Tax=Aquipuribacter nitratireducens TaxID=650104 RepID=A0ABW0GQ31_9MICO